MSDALAHLDAAIAALRLEAYRGRDPENMTPVDHFTIGEDLKRIDSQIGPTGASIFARIADNIEAAYVELLAARALIASGPLPEPRKQSSAAHEKCIEAAINAVFMTADGSARQIAEAVIKAYQAATAPEAFK